jgi:hypothetical protein
MHSSFLGEGGGYMRGHGPLASVSKEDRLVWEQKLIETSRASCLDHSCHHWDKYYNSSDDPILDERRRTDQANYLVWIPAYCDLLGVEEHNALLTLEQHRCCMPCLGRILYQTLRSEFVAQYTRQENFEDLRKSPDFPENLRKPRTRWEILRKGALLNLAAKRLAEGLTALCGHPHLDELAILLNHGINVPIRLTGGAFGILCFHLIENEFSRDMLRMRARRGNAALAYGLAFADASASAILNQVRYLRSRNPW